MSTSSSIVTDNLMSQTVLNEFQTIVNEITHFLQHVDENPVPDFVETAQLQTNKLSLCTYFRIYVPQWQLIAEGLQFEYVFKQQNQLINFIQKLLVIKVNLDNELDKVQRSSSSSSTNEDAVSKNITDLYLLLETSLHQHQDFIQTILSNPTESITSKKERLQTIHEAGKLTLGRCRPTFEGFADMIQCSIGSL